jgi:hypothetical protein
MHQKINEILLEVYNNSITGDKLKRGMVDVEFYIIEYLSENGYVKMINSYSSSKTGIQLTHKTINLIEEYGSWLKYKEEVLDKELKIDSAKKIAIKYWWLPIAISGVSLLLSLWAILKK